MKKQSEQSEKAKRSATMNKSLHLLFGQVANEMLALGIERRTILNDLKDYSCPIDAAFLKEVFRAIMYTQTGIHSTTELTNAQMKTVYETFQKFLAENYHLEAPWPSVEALYFEKWYN